MRAALSAAALFIPFAVFAAFIACAAPAIPVTPSAPKGGPVGTKPCPRLCADPVNANTPVCLTCEGEEGSR